MFNVGGGELLVILLVALLVLGPQRLPDAARQLGRVMGDIRRISSGFQQELRDALDVDEAPPRRSEPVPLAKAVADADDAPSATTTPATATPATADAPRGAGSGPPSLREVATEDADASSVAPAVADALDEIVAPARPVPVDPPAGDAGDEGLGGERAAS
jgi:sec-independent protein translocase protein TatB